MPASAFVQNQRHTYTNSYINEINGPFHGSVKPTYCDLSVRTFEASQGKQSTWAFRFALGG